MDVKCALLNGDITEDIYMQQPQGFATNPSLVQVEKFIVWAKASPQGLVCKDSWISVVT